jgi:homocitrate synthase NifV
MRPDIVLEDTTLRDGEQAPGVAFSKAQKERILDELLLAGVPSVEIGIPAMGGGELDAIRAMLERKNEARLVAWNRGNRADVEFSLGLGFDAVHIGVPTSDIHLADSVGKSRDWLLTSVSDIVRFAKDRGAFVSISAEDVGRTDPTFLVEYAGAVRDAGADRLRLSDTIGMLGPEKYGEIVAAVARVEGLDLQCHCHNDFGLAVANTLAGLKAGARYFHVCVNSMGERAGMPDLAQMVMSLRNLYGVDLGIRTERLTRLSHLVAEASRSVVPPWQPVVGSNVFAHESGIHAKGVLKNPRTFEPYAPEEVGATRRMVIGKHSGRAAIKSVLLEQGIECDDDLLQLCLERVREASIGKGGEVPPAELIEIYRQLAAQPAPVEA